MKRLILAFILTTVWTATPAVAKAQATDQPPIVDDVQVTGIDDDRLRPGLRRDIRALEGNPLDAAAVQKLTDRVGQEGEKVALGRERYRRVSPSVRTASGSDGFSLPSRSLSKTRSPID
jgi:hypothetical protein